jgi:hypothetical protein
MVGLSLSCLYKEYSGCYMGTRMTANGILKNFLNEGDSELPETNLLQLDEQVRKKYFFSLMPGFC